MHRFLQVFRVTTMCWRAGSGLRTKRFLKLRYVQQAGGRLAETSLRASSETSCPAPRFLWMYGQTEATARLSYLPPEYLESKMGVDREGHFRSHSQGA